MARFLFVVLPVPGHVYAPLAIADGLARRGHEVAWLGPESFLRPIVGPSATVYPTGIRSYREQSARGVESVRLLWEGYVVPLCRFVLPAAERAVGAFRPDVLVADQYALAGPLVAVRHGVRWATLAIGVLELVRPYRSEPAVEAGIQTQIDRALGYAGLPPGALDPRYSPDLALGLTSAELTGPELFPADAVLVGPALAPRPDPPPFDWGWLDPRRRRVLVTVGTMAQHMAVEFFARVVRALAPLGDRLQAVLVTPTATVPDPPAHILVAPKVPVLDLMPHLDAVVTHCGLNTVAESLAFGVPLVLAPLRHDQPAIAGQVVAAGAGVEVDFAAAGPAELRAAVTAVLERPRYRVGARRVAASFAAAGGTRAAVRHLVELADKALTDKFGIEGCEHA